MAYGYVEAPVGSLNHLSKFFKNRFFVNTLLFQMFLLATGVLIVKQLGKKFYTGFCTSFIQLTLRYNLALRIFYL